MAAYNTFTFASIVRYRLTEMDDICSQQARSLGSKYTKMRLPPGLCRKRILVYLEPRERAWRLQVSFFPLG